MVDKRYLKNFDVTLLLATIGVIGFGCAMIYSASSGSDKAAGYIEKQLIWAVLGLLISAVISSLHTSIYQRFAGKLYGLTLIMLAAVLIVGQSSKGAQRWLGAGPFQVQPSELAKIFMIIALAVFLVNRLDEIKEFRTFIKSFIYLIIPIALIFKQPDLGTSLVLVAIWLSMLFVLGTDIKNILMFIGAAILLGLIVWNVPHLMKDYQKNRVITFVNPAADPLGSGYHVTQSRIAIGSGKITGKGFLKGTQRELNFIPEQHTDFIFTVVGEELGFIGCVTLVLLFFVIIWRGLNIMASTEDVLGRAIAAGVVAMLLFHIFINLGMTLGIMPVTGVPLPMFSYGGSSLMANMMGIGLLEGVSMRRHRISF